MADILVPTLGESVSEATIGKWFKKPGDAVAVDEPLVELETDKVTIEVPAPAAGTLAEISAKDGDTVAVGAILGMIKEGAGGAKAAPAKAAPAAEAKPAAKPAPAAPAQPPKVAAADAPLAPSVRKIAAETGTDPAKVEGTGKKSDPFRYWLPTTEARWREDPLYEFHQMMALKMRSGSKTYPWK